MWVASVHPSTISDRQRNVSKLLTEYCCAALLTVFLEEFEQIVSHENIQINSDLYMPVNERRFCNANEQRGHLVQEQHIPISH